jgi:hypothetical protein
MRRASVSSAGCDELGVAGAGAAMVDGGEGEPSSDRSDSPGSGRVASLRGVSGLALGSFSGVGFRRAVDPGVASGPSVSGIGGGTSGGAALGVGVGRGGANTNCTGRASGTARAGSAGPAPRVVW